MFLAALTTFDWILLLVLVAVLIVIFRKFRSGSRRPTVSSPPPVDLSNLGVMDAKVGDMIAVRAAGEDYEDVEFKVDKINRYERGSHEWFELVGRLPKGRVFLGWDDDDELYVSLTLPGQKLRIEDLGLTQDDLVRFDEEQSRRNTVEHDGATYRYDRSSEVGYFDGGKGSGEGFYLWFFDTEDGKRNLSIEKWEDEASEAILSKYVSPEDVKVYR